MNTKFSPCSDCGKDTTPFDGRGNPLWEKFDRYLVRDEIWSKAGMNGWNSGHLCTPCLERRLGRKLTNADYLNRTIRVTKDGLVVFFHDDYLRHSSVGFTHDQQRRARTRKPRPFSSQQKMFVGNSAQRRKRSARRNVNAVKQRERFSLVAALGVGINEV